MNHRWHRKRARRKYRRYLKREYLWHVKVLEEAMNEKDN